MLHRPCDWLKSERLQRELNPTRVPKAVGEALFHLSAPRFEIDGV